MGQDTKWTIATGLGVVAAILAAATLVTARIDDVRADIRESRAVFGERLDGLDERLRAVEVAVAKVDQRLLTIERVVLPPDGE